MKRPFLASILVVIGGVIAVRAEIVPRSPDELREGASHIATGKVRLIATEVVRDSNWERTAGVVEIQVTRLEKGEGIEAGDCVYARFWREAWIGKGNPPPFGSGHRLPRKGDMVRAFLNKNDGGYDALLPNGFEILPKATNPPKSEPRKAP